MGKGKPSVAVRRLMVSNSPVKTVPHPRVEWAASDLVKRSKAWGRRSAGMPGPSSGYALSGEHIDKETDSCERYR